MGGGFFDTRLETPTDAARLLFGPLNDAGDVPDLRVVVPGHPDRSMLVRRLRSTGTDRMPPISSGVVATEGVALLDRWIASVEGRLDFAAWLAARFGPEVAAAADRDRDADGDGASDYLEFLVGTDPVRPGDAWRLELERRSGDAGMRLRFRQPAGVGVLLETTRDAAGGWWVPWTADGDAWVIPAVERERELVVPVDADPRYLRALLVVP